MATVNIILWDLVLKVLKLCMEKCKLTKFFGKVSEWEIQVTANKAEVRGWGTTFTTFYHAQENYWKLKWNHLVFEKLVSTISFSSTSNSVQTFLQMERKLFI